MEGYDAYAKTRKLSSVELMAVKQREIGGAISLHEIYLDSSSSMGQDNVDAAVAGLPALVHQIQENSLSLQRRPIVRIAVFSSEVEVLSDWSFIDEALFNRLASIKIESGGVTRLDLVCRDAIDAASEMKSAQDDLNIMRIGTSCFILTDGSNTDSKGNITPLPADLVDEVDKMQQSGRISFLALGMGDCLDEDLLKLAPPAKRKGSSIACAMRYNGTPTPEMWPKFRKIIADGSTGMSLEDQRKKMVEGYIDMGDYEIIVG